MIIGCTGHQSLTEETQDAVAQALLARLRSLEGKFEGVCSLAVGADQIFARVALSAGGRLHVVVPCEGYLNTFQTNEGRSQYERFLAVSTSREQLGFSTPTEEAFMEAGRTVVDRSNLVLAVWDGRPSAGFGGTADVVAYATSQSKSIEIIWPEGAKRT